LGDDISKAAFEESGQIPDRRIENALRRVAAATANVGCHNKVEPAGENCILQHRAKRFVGEIVLGQDLFFAAQQLLAGVAYPLVTIHLLRQN
jgi:hypothetical protein